MNAMASQITDVSIVCPAVCSGANQIKHQSSKSLAFVRGFPPQVASNAENVSIWWRHHINSPDISKAACVRRKRCWRTVREVIRGMVKTRILSHSIPRLSVWAVCLWLDLDLEAFLQWPTWTNVTMKMQPPGISEFVTDVMVGVPHYHLPGDYQRPLKLVRIPTVRHQPAGPIIHVY